MRSPGDRGAAKPGKLRPSSFKVAALPPAPSQPQPTLFRIPENPKIVWGGGGGGDPPVLNRVQHYSGM